MARGLDDRAQNAEGERGANSKGGGANGRSGGANSKSGGANSKSEVVNSKIGGANSKSGRQIRRVSKYTDHNRMLIKKYPKELTHSLIDITRSLEAKERRGAKTGDNGRGSRRRRKKKKRKKIEEGNL